MEVIRRIPYLRSGSDLCQPSATSSYTNIPAPADCRPAPSSTAPDVGTTDIPVPGNMEDLLTKTSRDSSDTGRPGSDAEDTVVEKSQPREAAAEGSIGNPGSDALARNFDL